LKRRIWIPGKENLEEELESGGCDGAMGTGSRTSFQS